MLNPEELVLDVSAEGARALHRVVRAMHDGHCPACGYLASADQFQIYGGTGHRCPKCQFAITPEEARAALKAFQPHFHKSVEIFERWRNGQPIEAGGERCRG